MQRLVEHFRYRPEIDGLRAIAVVAVVLFHAGLGVPGGFVGVDVFFVISGFLITSIILRDLEAGKFSLIEFWERRARRIAPAATVLVLAVLLAGWFLLMPSDYVALGKSAGMHAAFAANFYFWRNTNYFAGAAEEQPLLHTWSLAVEEQFYLFVPLLLLFLFRYARFRRRGVLLCLCLAGFILSLGLSAVLLPRSPAATFYLLPTRAWELLAGSTVALLPASALSRGWRELLGTLGLSAVLLPCFLYSKDMAFPGLAALAPCVGTALFIWATGKGTADGAQVPSSASPELPISARLLSTRPLVLIGLISYSLYLWHWPLFAFSSYWALEPLSLVYRLSLVSVSLVLAFISWRFIETPFRFRRLGTSRSRMFAWAGIGLATSGVAAVTLWATAGLPNRFSETVNRYDSAKAESLQENHFINAATLQNAFDQKFPCLGAASPAPVTLMVWGDSHARSILPAVDCLGLARNQGVVAAWHSSTAPVLGYQLDPRREVYSLGSDTPAFSESVLNFIATQKIPSVLLAARWSAYFETESHPDSGLERGTFGRKLVETVRRIHAAGSTPWILIEVPNHQVPASKALVYQEMFASDISRFAGSPETLESRNREIVALIPELEAAGGKIIDVSSLLFDPANRRFRMVGNGEALYYDKHHLTRNGALYVRDALIPVFDISHERTAPKLPIVPAH